MELLENGMDVRLRKEMSGGTPSKPSKKRSKELLMAADAAEEEDYDEEVEEETLEQTANGECMFTVTFVPTH